MPRTLSEALNGNDGRAGPGCTGGRSSSDAVAAGGGEGGEAETVEQSDSCFPPRPVQLTPVMEQAWLMLSSPSPAVCRRRPINVRMRKRPDPDPAAEDAAAADPYADPDGSPGTATERTSTTSEASDDKDITTAAEEGNEIDPGGGYSVLNPTRHFCLLLRRIVTGPNRAAVGPSNAHESYDPRGANNSKAEARQDTASWLRIPVLKLARPIKSSRPAYSSSNSANTVPYNDSATVPRERRKATATTARTSTSISSRPGRTSFTTSTTTSSTVATALSSSASASSVRGAERNLASNNRAEKNFWINLIAMGRQQQQQMKQNEHDNEQDVNHRAAQTAADDARRAENGGGGTKAASADKEAAAAGSQWRTAIDPRSGRTYYYHTETRQSQWRKPPELATPRELEEAREKEQQQREFFAAMEANILRSISTGAYCCAASPSSTPAAADARRGEDARDNRNNAGALSPNADAAGESKGAHKMTPQIPQPPLPAITPSTSSATAPSFSSTRPLPLVRTISGMDENLLRELVRRVPSHRNLLSGFFSSAAAALSTSTSNTASPPSDVGQRTISSSSTTTTTLLLQSSAGKGSGENSGSSSAAATTATALLGPIREHPQDGASFNAFSSSSSWFEQSWVEPAPGGNGAGAQGISGGDSRQEAALLQRTEAADTWNSEGSWNVDPRDGGGGRMDDYGRTSSSMSMTSLLQTLPPGSRGAERSASGTFSSLGGNESTTSFGMDESETLALRRLSEIADRMCGMEWEESDAGDEEEHPVSPLIMEHFLSPMPVEERATATAITEAGAVSRSPGSDSSFSLASTTDSVASTDPAEHPPPIPLGSRYESPIRSTGSDDPTVVPTFPAREEERAVDIVLPKSSRADPNKLEEAEAGTVTKVLRSPRPAPIGCRRNTCGTLYVKSTMSAPDKDATIQCMCAVYRAHILQSLAEASDDGDRSVSLEVFAVFDDEPVLAASRTSARASIGGSSSRGRHPPPRPSASPFAGDVAAPTLEEVTRFYRHVFFRAKMEPDTIIMTLIYVERLIKCSQGRLRPRTRNWRSLLFSCAVLSSKVWDDMSMWNGDFTQVSPPGVRFSLQRINELEVQVLSLLNYNVKVPASEYAKYYFLMRSMLIKSGLGTSDDEFITPLDVEGAKRLQQLTSNYSLPAAGGAPSPSSSSNPRGNTFQAAGGHGTASTTAVPVTAMARSRSVGAPYASSEPHLISPSVKGTVAAAPTATPRWKKAGLEHVVKL